MATKNFLFLECEGSTGRTARSKKQLKNRHAQLGHSSSKGSEGVSNAGPPSAPLPVQIKFKTPGQAQEIETYFGRCSHCRKRRKLVRLTNRCRECDKESPSRPQTTELVEVGNRASSEWAYERATALLPITCDISCGMKGCPADRKAMDYFLNFAALDLSGYLPGRFWDGFVLQGSQSEPMVRQAVLAVSNAHMDHCNLGMTTEASLASYQATVNKLRGYMTRTANLSPELVLLCCILLFTFDRLRGDNGTAAIHLKSAMAILTTAGRRLPEFGHERQPASTNHHAMDDLTNMLLQMDIEDTMPALDRGPLLDIGVDLPDVYSGEPPAMKFFSPHDFMHHWMRICHAVWAFVGTNANHRHVPVDQVPPSIFEHRNNLQRWVKTWRAAFKDFTRLVHMPAADGLPSGSPSPELHRQVIDAVNALIIESHYFVIKSVLAESLPSRTESRPWDVIAEKMLQCGEKALSLRQAYRKMHSLPARKTFSTHVGIAESLLALSHRTASPDVRSRAQRLIRGFRDVSGDLTGVTAFFAGYGAPPSDLVLIYEKPGH